MTSINTQALTTLAITITLVALAVICTAYATPTRCTPKDPRITTLQKPKYCKTKECIPDDLLRRIKLMQAYHAECNLHRKELPTRLPEMLDEDVYLHRNFLRSLNETLIASANRRERMDDDYNGVQGTDFVHVVYDGDEPQAVVYHGETIKDQLVEADHKRYNLGGAI